MPQEDDRVGETEPAARPFVDGLEEHLAAIANRDLAGLKATIADGELILITANGELHRRSEDFLALHEEWFQSESWTIDTNLVHTIESPDLAIAVLELGYRDVDDSGGVIHDRSYLTLVFRREGDRWLMVQDQNTPIK